MAGAESESHRSIKDRVVSALEGVGDLTEVVMNTVSGTIIETLRGARGIGA